MKKEWPLLAARLPQSERGPSASNRNSSESSEEEIYSNVPHRRRVASASCADALKCASLGLVGDCCPNAQGDFLDCCAGSATGSNGEEVGEADTPHPTYAQPPPTPATPIEHGVTDEWRAILFMDMAVIDRVAAFENLVKLGDDIGSGASKTNALMWAVSQPKPANGVKKAYTATHSAPRECDKNSACDASGMLGNCCPNDAGGDLSCCPKVTGILQD